MKKSVILIVVLVISFMSIGQTKKIEILFANNGVERKLNNDFNIYFIYQDSIQKVIYKAIAFDEKYISIPTQMPLNEKLKYYILFEYKKKIYYCDYREYLTFYEADAFLIHIQKKPFYKFVSWGHNKFNFLLQIKRNEDKSFIGEMEIVYGRGDCAATYTRITNFKEYFKKGRKLLRF